MPSARHRAHRLSVAGFALVLVAVGCRGPASAEAAPVTTDTVWYVSARARDAAGRDTRRLADSLQYGIMLVRVTGSGDPLLHRVQLAAVDSIPLTAAEFVASLRARARVEPDSTAVLMVHGFATSFSEAWAYAAEARHRSRAGTPWIAFCWPSNGSGVAWPRADQIIARAYREDSAAASASQASFARALQDVIDAVGSARLLVVAHSMGAQLVGESLARDTTIRARLITEPLRALAFVAPDVPALHFRERVLPTVRPLARRTVVYTASDDRMLQLSRTINHSERAGLARSPAAPVAGAEIVDVTDGVLAEGPVQRVVGTHHAIKRASATLFDLQIVAREYTPDCRTTLHTASLDATGVWRLNASLPPALAALGSCAKQVSQ